MAWQRAASPQRAPCEIGRASCRDRVSGSVGAGSSRRRHTRLVSDWSSDVCSSDLPERYRAVARAYMEGLSARVAAGQPLERVASVASFFLSRIDTAVDNLLDGLAARGQPAARTLRDRKSVV